MQDKLNPGKPMELPEMDMHAAVEIKISAYMRKPDGTIGTLAAYAQPGQLPTRAEQLAIVAALIAPESLQVAGAPAGTRPLNKREFVAHITKRASGMEIPMPGNPEFVPAGCEIPHSLLVHAIVGAGEFASMETCAEYEQRGLMKFIGNQHNPKWGWDQKKLAELPEDMLLTIYKRVA